MKAITHPKAVAILCRALESARLSAWFLGLSLAVLAVMAGAALFGLDGVCAKPGDTALFIALAAASALGLALAFILRSRRALGFVLAAEYAICLAFSLYFPVSSLSWLFLALASLAPISLYLGFPRSLAMALAAWGAAILLRFAVFPPESVGQRAASFRDVLAYVAAPPVFSALLSVLSALGAETSRVSEALMDVTRLNLSYQDYSAAVEERSAHEERLRLTRDIHDVVGYALTNTMMLMRAASIMVKDEPERLPALIETTQAGVVSAHEQVRELLRDIRRRELRSAAGPEAIAKVVRVFRTATGAEVDLDFGNFDWAIGGEEAFAAYHFVQEAMLNAFSHGKASSIRVSFRQSEEFLAVTVRDNGSGARIVVEGIGISGMRERLAKLGGELEYSSTAEGFSITMRLPPPEREASA